MFGNNGVKINKICGSTFNGRIPTAAVVDLEESQMETKCPTNNARPTRRTVASYQSGEGTVNLGFIQ